MYYLWTVFSALKLVVDVNLLHLLSRAVNNHNKYSFLVRVWWLGVILKSISCDLATSWGQLYQRKGNSLETNDVFDAINSLSVLVFKPATPGA